MSFQSAHLQLHSAMKTTFLLTIHMTIFSFTTAYYGVGDSTYTTCPTPKTGLCPSPAVNPSIYACTDHSQCKGSRLCCSSNGNTFCSDPVGSKSSAKCPKHIENKGQPCYSDFNCDFGPGSISQTCCFDESTCASYCAEDVPVNPITDPIAALNDLKSDKDCPVTLKNSKQECLAHSDCPRNQVCCLNGRNGKSCSDPRVLVQGVCPLPSRMPGGFPCASDSDCNSELYKGQKCCRLDDSHYRCVYPDDDDIVTTNTTTISPIISTIPVTWGPIEIITIPGSNYSSADCPTRYKRCPIILRNPGSVCSNDSDCPSDEVCCRTSLFGLKYCYLPRGMKPGTCPPTDKIVGVRANECYWDSNCRGVKKCCGVSGCSTYNCVIPFELH